MPKQQKCLVVDDSAVIREIAVRILTELNIDVGQAESASAGLDYCREFKPAAVLLDWDLPAMGALDFLRGAADLPAEERPAIVLCATENDPQQFTLARAAGAEYHILKPFDKASIQEKLVEIGFVDVSVEPESKAASK